MRAVILEGQVKLLVGQPERPCREISIWKPAQDIQNFREHNYNFNESASIHKGKTAMYERAARLPQLLITWALLADGKQARIYECRKIMQKVPLGGANIHHYYDEQSGHELVLVPNGAMEAESIDDYQIGHDRRGTSSSSNSSTHNTYEPHGDIQKELKRRFIKAISDKLQQACANNSFDRLILVAPAKMVGELRKQLSSDVQNRIVGVLPKDLTHDQGQVAMTHLRDIFAKARDE
jgi:protein required for attachment to host cells